MTSDVVLTAALRNNLLSLQSTQNQIDETQFRLATGRRVNSALDNPQNFFAAQSLNNRAGDLNRLLDGIGQSIRVIEEADNGVTALTNLVEQADSIATQAIDALSAAQSSAVATGSATNSLSGTTDLTSLSGISDGDTFLVQVGSAAQTTVTISSGLGINGLIADLNDITNVEAALNSDGQLEIRTTNGEELRLANLSGTALTSVSGLGFTQVDATVETITATISAAGTSLDTVGNFSATDSFTITVGSGSAVTITIGSATTGAQFTSLINAVSGVTATQSGTTLTITSTNGDAINFAELVGVSGAEVVGAALTAEPELEPRGDGTTFLVGDSLTSTLQLNGAVAARTATISTLDGFTIGSATGDDLALIVTRNGTAQTSVDLDLDGTISDLIDEINSNSNATGLTATFDDTTGQLSIAADSTVTSFTLDGSDLETGESLGFGFGNGATDLALGTAAAVKFVASNGATDNTVAQLASDYNEVRSQIDAIIEDASFAGTNLLNGDDLVTVFNEDRSNSLTTQGVTFNSAGLGLSAADFSSSGTINTALTEVRGALTTLRNFGSTLANDLAVIQTRQDFTSETINTLESGADDLTIADQNAEGARLLALQTRQQLGVTSLSLASQSQQSVLRLF